MAASLVRLALGVLVSVVAGTFMVIGVGLLYSGLASRRFASRIERSADDTVRDAIHGDRVCLEGTATEHEESLRAPFSGQSCLGYQYGIARYSSDSDTAGTDDWARYVDGENAVPFRLETDTGTVLVRPAGATLELRGDDYVTESAAGEDPPEDVGEFLSSETYARTSDRSLGRYVHSPDDPGERHRYSETRLEPGETAFFSGVGRPPGDVEGLPRGIDAVVAPDGGTAGGLLGRLGTPAGVVSDGSLVETAEDLGSDAGRRLAGGVFLLGVSGLVAYSFLL